MTNIIGLGQDLDGKITNSRIVVTEELGIQRMTEITTATTYSAGLSSIGGGGLNVPAIYSIHPEFQNMSVEAVSVSNKPGGLAEITTQYVGFLNDVEFYWPPDQTPASFAPNPAAAPKIVPGIRLFPAGTPFDKFLNPSGDWVHFPVVVQISFIDSVANEELLYSDWKVNVTEMPSGFRGYPLPQPPVAPYAENLPDPVPDGFKRLVYFGPRLSSINVDRRGSLFNQVRITFKDYYKVFLYQVGSA